MFHGICIDQKVIALDGSESPLCFVARSLLASEKLAPVATLNKVSWDFVEACEEFQLCFHNWFLSLQIKTPYRPVECNLSSLPTDRDRLPSGKQIIALTLTWVHICFWHTYTFLSGFFCFHFFVSLDFCSYKFKLEDSAEVKPHVPLLNNRIYDNKFESQFYRISDSNKVRLFSFQKIVSLTYLFLFNGGELDVLSFCWLFLVLIKAFSSFPWSAWMYL